MARDQTTTVLGRLRSQLPAEVFRPATSRLLWLPVHIAVITGAVILQGQVSLGLQLVLSLVIGASFSGLAFVAHEALHGALTKNRRLMKLVGFLGFLPFCISPRLWMAWHNRVHHNHTNHPTSDPDANPTLLAYQKSAAVRITTDIQRLTRGLLTLLIGFSVQSTHILCVSKTRGYLSGRHFRAAVLETLLGVSLWAGLLAAVGPALWVLGFVLPLFIANVVVMAHIVTNHSLRPHSLTGDALDTSLSVSVPRLIRFLTLGFGYHVEHHLMPTVSHRHGPKIQALLKQDFPRRYRELPLRVALLRVCRAPRVHRSAAVLVDPLTQRELTLSLPPAALQQETDLSQVRSPGASWPLEATYSS